ncbi:exodeoxyribonuclease V subunit beta [Litoribrevibacter euphylliae]|uniref:RecBCD enzyme subunit RecB n=1 Tax=Litoribrevibacter euphylliae TaxID=1834034 RepID=A0ABV7HCS2_9GAMM
MAISLNPMTFPLYGERLIEASAGTGKTYTITSLYLRLLLGHGVPSSDDVPHTNDEIPTAFSRKLLVDEILVVTFTEAATQELKDRIRKRIKEARKAFEQYLDDQVVSGDPALKTLIQEVADTKDAITTLRYAERQMDEAAIFTIHGFCIRMLQQHAFESGNLFNVQMCDDDRELKYQAVKDYWRQQFYPLPKALIKVVLECWSTPDELLNEIGYLLSDTPLSFLQDYSIDDIEIAHQTYLQQIDTFKQTLGVGLAELHSSILADVQAKQLDGRSFSKNNVAKWAASVERWASEPTCGYLIPKELEHFGKSKLEAKAKGALTVDWNLAESIQSFVDQPPELKPALKQHAIKVCREIYKRQKSQRGLLTFDDQISTMARALSSEGLTNENTTNVVDAKTGFAFAQKLRQQFPVAMVDEFQDTDQSQYQIFSRIYGRRHSSSKGDREDVGLFMIGDPKQAIYAFRGGDIFTYMKARKNVADHYTLDTNWRSSAAMVASVNQMFDCAESAFIYDQDIPFDPVNSSSKAKHMHWSISGDIQPALCLWQPDTNELLPKDSDYLSMMTEATANEVARLLTLSDQKTLTLNSEMGEKVLAPSSIAILVRNFGQAQRIRSALAERGIASVYSSDRSSVFEQQEAKVLLRVLKAALMPESESLVKAAIGSDLFGWRVSQLNRLNEDELIWEQLVMQFKQFHQVWLTQGVLPAFHQLMLEQQVALHLSTQVNGERRLTDLLHLCELLQNQSKSVESQYALVSWLEERIQQPNQNSQEQQLRLESEDNLVKVVTYHKSKGLEYDVVFAPFVSYFWPNNRQGVSITHDDEGNSLVDVTDQHKAEVAKERIAEDIRLLYVTLTRSIYACYLGLPGLMAGTKTKPDPKICPKYMSETGLGWLVGQGKAVTPDMLEDVIQQWLSLQSEHSTIRRSLPNLTYTEYEPPEKAIPELSANQFNSRIDYNWWVTSYSRLVSENHHVAITLPTMADDQEGANSALSSDYDASVETKGEDANLPDLHQEHLEPLYQPEDVTFAYDIHHFPKGAEAGTFLHLLFESIEFQECESEETRETIQELLTVSPLSHQLVERELPSYRLLGKTEQEADELKNKVIERWVDVLHSMIINVLAKPLQQGDDAGSTDFDLPILMNTASEQRLVEMEFLIPFTELDCQSVNRIIQQDRLTARAQQGLTFSNVQGMLKGFIDLIFEANGKFYVLDWKSNYLGVDAEAYTQSAMQDAMLGHRYDFQYQLYTLALHRYLKSRLSDYDYDIHIGGAYYVFLRGVTGNEETSSPFDTASESGVFFTKAPKAMIEALDQLFSGQAVEHPDKPILTDERKLAVSEDDVFGDDVFENTGISTSGDQGELF